LRKSFYKFFAATAMHAALAAKKHFKRGEPEEVKKHVEE
jgi:hypothetical protein